MPPSATEEVPASASSEVPTIAVAADGTEGKGTHSQILKSSAMVGGSQLLNIGIGVIRTKAMAVMLGPGGFGLFGLYSSVSNIIQTLAGMGINSSGVRQIAAAVSDGDQERIAETAMVLRRVAVVLGLLGAVATIAFSRQISILTFASDKHRGAICWLSLAVLFTLISSSQTALIQGVRRIADLAKMQVLGALFGTLFGIPLVYVYRDRGVVPALICVAATAIVTSWWYSRKVPIPNVTRDSSWLGGSKVRQEVSALLKLGLAFMVSSFITLGVAYAIRVSILHRVGIESTGLYQSAWTLGGLYVGIILQAMGADFYPRLTASASDNVACNRLVNEQTLVGLLLTGPGVIASLTFAPLVIALFYSAKFGAGVGILRWICLGAALQVVSFPMGYVIVAKAKRALFIGCEVAWGVVSVGLAWTLIARYGLTGAGISYFGSYVFHCFMLYGIVGRLSGFRWSRENIKIGAMTLVLIGIVFCGLCFLPLMYGVALGTVALLVDGVYSVRLMTSFFEPERIPGPIRKVLTACGLVGSNRTRLAEFS